MSNLHLIDASGKDDLSGGIFTGITAKLRDAQVAFRPQITLAQTGTATTN